MARAVTPPPDGCYPNYTTAEGCNALKNLGGGLGNTGVGWYSLYSDVESSYNTAVGGGALALNDGDSNTAVGAAALLLNTSGTVNTATGTDALLYNDSGSSNTANGAFALFSNTSGGSNTGIGFSALFNNIEGGGNTAVGNNALFSNTTGSSNTALGSTALYNNTEGGINTAIGSQALYDNTTGTQNTAIGLQALSNNNTGNNNTANGYRAGLNVTGDGNVSIGASVVGEAGVDNTTWIRNVYTTVQPVVGTDPDNVTVNSDGRLGRGNVSSRRYKHDIKPMDKASQVLYRLEPVSFRYKKEYDATQTLAFGLIAEDVARVDPDLVGRNPEGQPESVRYQQINAMLLNEFLKEHRKNEKQEATVALQQKEIAALSATVKEQAAQIQEVRAQLATARPADGGLEASEFATGRIRHGGPAPHVVLNNQ